MENQTQPVEKKLFDNSFKVRALSALVLFPLVLGTVFFGNIPFLLMMVVVAAISVHEWGRMTLSDKQGSICKFIAPAAIFCSAATVAISGVFGNPASTIWLLLFFSAFIWSYNFAHQGASIKKFIIGIIYIVFAIEVMVWIRNFSPNGLFHTMTLILSVWACDTFAYISGKSIGGPKMAPKASPNKTWSGLLGGAFGSATVLAVLAFTYPDLTIGGFGVVVYFLLGFVLALFGQAGDILISIVKRHYGVKDTGNVIPGHGGILDRIDALILVAIILGTLIALSL